MSDTSTLLLVDDTQLNLQVLMKILGTQGYELLAADSGETALSILEQTTPDLVLLDIMMPGISGLDLCRTMQQDPRWKDIPVIFITAMQGAENVAEGLAAGAVDYVTKPFNKLEILARVRTHLRLHAALQELERLNTLALDANPLSGLPGNNTVNQMISDFLKSNAEVTVVYVDLDNFKAFNDAYGYLKGDEALLLLAGLLKDLIVARSDLDPHFVGHIGGDDFVLILPEAQMRAVVREVANAFDSCIVSLYSDEDQAQGGITSVDRQNVERFFPLMTISMGGVPLRHHAFAHVQEVSNACADVKKKAKAIPGSSFYMDQRKDE